MSKFQPCDLCGAKITGGRRRCRDKYLGSVLIREFTNPEYATTHLLTVDCYALQHPEEHGPRSNGFHLLRLYWILFGGGSPDVMKIKHDPMPRVTDKHYYDFDNIKAPPPLDRGDITILSVFYAKNPAENHEVIYLWAQSVWQAYHEYHDWVKHIMTEALNANN